VRVDNESWRTFVRRQRSPRIPAPGPDIILGTNDDANLTGEAGRRHDLANYLGKKYGGWYDAGAAYLRPNGKNWIGIPLGAAGSMMVYARAR